MAWTPKHSYQLWRAEPRGPPLVAVGVYAGYRLSQGRTTDIRLVCIGIDLVLGLQKVDRPGYRKRCIRSSGLSGSCNTTDSRNGTAALSAWA